jgi:hypothetical protein
VKPAVPKAWRPWAIASADPRIGDPSTASAPVNSVGSTSSARPYRARKRAEDSFTVNRCDVVAPAACLTSCAVALARRADGSSIEPVPNASS